jgi:hypothetical protein
LVVGQQPKTHQQSVKMMPKFQKRFLTPFCLSISPSDAMAGVLDTMMIPEVSTEILADAFHFEVAVKSSGYCGVSMTSLPVPPSMPPVPGSSSEVAVYVFRKTHHTTPYCGKKTLMTFPAISWI